jgi:hypothetical protein
MDRVVIFYFLLPIGDRASIAGRTDLSKVELHIEFITPTNRNMNAKREKRKHSFHLLTVWDLNCMHMKGLELFYT